MKESLNRHPAPATPESELQRTFRFFAEGKKQEAKPMLLAVAADEREDPWSRMWAALDIIDQLDAAGKNNLRATMWPLLMRLAREGNFLQIADAARILRRLPNTGNLSGLLQLLGRKSFVGQKTPYVAAMAIRELGSGVRHTALARLSEMAIVQAKEQGCANTGGEMPAALLSLAWLGGEPEFQRIEPICGDTLRPLWGAALQRDERTFLLRVLRTPGKLPPDAIDWVVIRLGELKERRSVGALVQQLSNTSWQVTRSAQDSLIQIGGPDVASAARDLLDGKGPATPREAALNILYALDAPGSLPHLRKALLDKDLRTPALDMLGKVGTVEDLNRLVPMSDFWTGDRESHYWLMLATAGIRERNP